MTLKSPEEIKEPTSDQCSAQAKVYEDDHQVGYAIWYPQMGGYVGKAVALVRPYMGGAGCIDVLVWHDGMFPFGDEDRPPVSLHHCDPAQFIEFGETLSKLNGGKG